MRPRGSGRVYRRGGVFWVAYSRNGHEFRESAETTDERKAWRFLNSRVEDAKRPQFVGPTEKRLMLDDLEDKILVDYERHGRRSPDTVKHCLKPVKAHFGYDTLLQITPQRIEAYQTMRLKADMARASVNREVRYLLHGYRLLFDVVSPVV